jgi:hypothetical protein
MTLYICCHSENIVESGAIFVKQYRADDINVTHDGRVYDPLSTYNPAYYRRVTVHIEQFLSGKLHTAKSIPSQGEAQYINSVHYCN